jgi:hypothetical protein
MGLTVTREQVLRYRARASHMDAKLPPGSFATAAWGGLQDSVPRAGVISLHARVQDTEPGSWEDPSIVQIWFRGGADYIVPREDVGVFTLGSYPRDPDQAAELEALADEVHRLTRGRMTPVRELPRDLGGKPLRLRNASITGRTHIRWDASNIWLIPVERPTIDVEDARRELARRFMHWFGPATRPSLATWIGAPPRDAKVTWEAIDGELEAVEIEGIDQRRFMLAADVETLREAKAIDGVRLTPFDDAFTKLDRAILVPDDARREIVLPRTGQSRGFIPGAIVVDGEVVGAWQRQQRKVTLHPFTKLPARVREAIEQEALTFPIAGSAAPTVTWA